MKFGNVLLPLICLLTISMCWAPLVADDEEVSLRVAISFSPELSAEAQDGRLLLLLSTDPAKEPRFQIVDGPESQLGFGIDVEGWRPGEEAIVGAEAFGYPIEHLSDVPPGEYYVQALFNRYETFHLATGHTVKLPPDKGEGQHWNKKPGNFYSTPRKVKIDPGKAEQVSIELDQVIPEIPAPKDTKYIKHVRIKSELLSKFWGRDMYLGAVLLLPEGFEEHPQSRYPLVVNHGHFPYSFGGFKETPPPPDLKPEYSKRFHLEGYNKIVWEHAYQFYKEWTGPDFPRVIIMKVQHANPYYDDSYAVNSANLGPYGDAINHELIPYVEKKFRGLGQGWARFTYGGSTGGWEALATQVFYPDMFNGAYVACPDPIDFRAYTIVNIYEHQNAYRLDSHFKRTPRPGHRNYLGEISSMLVEMNHRELLLGTKSRSGQQWDIWEAVYSPQGPDGYPQRIWDKKTGQIDHRVAEYWKEHYDLRYIMEQNWKTLGPKLVGKINIYVGEMDNYYLNNAVYLMEDFLENTRDPYYAGEIDYGARDEHCWNGDHHRPNAISRLRYHQMFVPRIAKRILETAPAGADTSSWRY